MPREAHCMDVSGLPYSPRIGTLGNSSRILGGQRKASELRVCTCLVPSL